MTPGLVWLRVSTLGTCRHEVEIWITEERPELWAKGVIDDHFCGHGSFGPGRKPGEVACRTLLIEPRHRRRGIASFAYRLLSAELAKLGEVLTSALEETEQNEGARAIWRPLLRLGCAEVATDEQGRIYYRLTNPDGLSTDPADT